MNYVVHMNYMDIMDNVCDMLKQFYYYTTSVEQQIFYDACFDDDVYAVKKLIDKNVDINMKDCYGETFFHYACKRGSRNIVKLLIAHGANINERFSGGETPLMYVCANNDVHIAKILLDNEAINDDCNKTVLHTACFHKRYEIVKLLIEYGVNVNEKNMFGEIPLYCVCRNGDTEVAKILLDNGAFVNEYCYTQSALHIACLYGRVDVVVLLLNYGANIYGKNHNGSTPLMIAQNNKYYNIINILKKERNKRIYVMSLIINSDVLKHCIMKKID